LNHGTARSGWLPAGAGLLKLDREHKQIISYRNDPSDDESLASNDVISIFQDNEGNIWTSFQEAEPNHFSERPQALENFTYQRGSLANPLVTAIYEDHHGILWIGTMGGLNRIDLHTGRNTLASGWGPGNEILSILQDRSGVLVAGTYHHGLQRLDPETGKASPYVRSHGPSNLAQNPIMQLMFDHEGNLWAAAYGGVSRLDPSTGNFVTYTPDKQDTIQYGAITEDSKGLMWLGAQSGLQRFDPGTGRFTIFAHDPDDPRTLSDNRVNSVFFDRSGGMWVGTQNGLDKFDPSTGTFKVYYERDGLAGNVVSCILEDGRGRLWMSTNNGLSTFDPRTQRFNSFSAADGLPGPDLTGWSVCFKSPSGEMFFGGFSGATAFYPSRIVESSFVPRTVLTDFRLSGSPVPIGPKSPLKKSITYAGSITLSHSQNSFAIQFSALSYFDAATNRYRYKLEGLDHWWHEVGSDERIANYTTLPAGAYIFRVQGATGRGSWSDPGATLRIEILPPWWNTRWFRALCAAVLLALLWAAYQARTRQLREQERKFREAVETMPAQAFVALPDGYRTFVNRRWAEYTGMTLEQASGSGWQTAIHPDDLKRVINKWKTSAATGEHLEYETRLRRGADGEYRWFLVHVAPLLDKRRSVVKWYGVATDIEDRKRAEEERERLRQLEADLAHINRVSVLGELAASIAHEVNQPLSGVVSNGSACLRFLAGDAPNVEEAREAARDIVRDGKRAGEIISRIRALTKRAASPRDKLDLNETIRDVLALVGDEVKRKNVIIRTQLADGLPPVSGDRVQLQQVLLNLVMNATEAMSRAEERSRELVITTRNLDPHQVQITVKDSGPGIDPQTIDKIFDSFYTTKPGGMGMGLSISRSIVQVHGGRLWATVNNGPGTSFHFTLPKYQDEESNAGVARAGRNYRDC
jgi:PAS domain S-box-containing protein